MHESHQLRVITVEVLLRCCTNHIFGLFGFAAYTISFTAIAYTLGLIQNATFCNELFPMGAVFLVVVLGNTDSYMVHSLEDIKQWKSFNVKVIGKHAMLGFLIGVYMPAGNPMWTPVSLLVFVSLKISFTVRALASASKDVMQKGYIFLADYMKTEHQSSDSNQVDPSSLRGYKYFVKVAKETKAHLWEQPPNYHLSLAMRDDVITVEKVWNCSGRLLSACGGDLDGQLKDLCLSFSLFNLIVLRFAGYSLPREAHDKLWSLIHQILLSEENGYERVFRVIEGELAFLFDLLYTNFSVTPSPCRIVLEVLQPVGLLSFSLAIISSYQKSPNERTWSNADALIMFFMMITVLVVAVVQFSIRIFSEWAKILYICMYVRNEWCQRNRCVEKLIEIMCGINLRKPWGRQLRRYSLLEKCSYCPTKLIYNNFTAVYFDQKRDGRQEIAPTKLSKEVMKAITQSLMNSGTRNLENGRASLRRNNVFDQLSWACDLESTTHVIMVWHIATSLCEHEQRGTFPFPQASQGQRENFHIATVLSKYLAYSVAFAPKLLPDHPCRSEYIFGCVVNEARALFEGSSILMDERIQKLKVLDDEKNGRTIVGRGARLGRQLLIEAADEEHVWAILADFWAEMMLYVTPSNDAWAHAKYLSTGGEFVTHVWVLLSHAGTARGPHGNEQHDDLERC
ncbi:hypothetical protein BT93_D0253 [Corymbia citriodora subsp. variegata]|nr:hypothetical protein BT93_D0253 [Corymbia citriodora subsp. variegata]